MPQFFISSRALFPPPSRPIPAAGEQLGQHLRLLSLSLSLCLQLCGEKGRREPKRCRRLLAWLTPSRVGLGSPQTRPDASSRLFLSWDFCRFLGDFSVPGDPHFCFPAGGSLSAGGLCPVPPAPSATRRLGNESLLPMEVAPPGPGEATCMPSMPSLAPQRKLPC